MTRVCDVFPLFIAFCFFSHPFSSAACHWTSHITNVCVSTVSRLCCRNTNYDVQLIVDVNDVFEANIDDKLHIVLASTLNLDGTPTPETYDPSIFSQPTLADKFDYVMYGKVFKFKPEDGQKLSVIISFGGLLLYIKAEPRILGLIQLDSNVFLLMRKAQ